MESFFAVEGSRMVASGWTRGPWSHDHMHGGPPAAILARALEAELEGQVTRFDVEFVRPLPISAFGIDVLVTRAGRKVQAASAVLVHEGREVARARALAIRQSPLDLPPPRHQPGPPAAPEHAAPYAFTFFQDSIAYHAAVELRAVRGQWGSGAFMAWIRMRMPLVAGETPSPLQRIVCGADAGNGLSAALDPARFTFVSADLTVYLHRHPAGEEEWICYDAVTVPQATGVGLAECGLYDRSGGLGRSLQSLVVEAR